MAIYSLHHSSIGKSTQAEPYTAGAHVNYITRKSALSRVEGARLPLAPGAAAAFMRKAEDKLRKNGRVADKLMLALPRELTSDQRAALVHDFAQDITDGRAPWFAAVHEKGKDSANPHCHLIICDRDSRTGKRVFGTSEKGSTERLRKLWEDHANRALAEAHHQARIDRRTLLAQGKTRRPTIHIGVRATQLVRGRRGVASRDRVVRNHCQAHTRERKVAYPAIDAGQPRLAHNVKIRRSNLLLARAQGHEADYWAAINEDAFLRDIDELRRLHAVLEFSDDGRDAMRSRDERRDRGGPDR